MKKRWALMSALGLLAPVAVATPMLATSCGEDKKEVTKVDKPTPQALITDDDTNVTNFAKWQEKMQDSSKIKDNLGVLFSKHDGLDEKNVASIKVTESKQNSVNDPQSQEAHDYKNQPIKITVTLKDGFAFNGETDHPKYTEVNSKLTLNKFHQ